MNTPKYSDFIAPVKTATATELRRNFRLISSWIEHGQTISITRRGCVIAHLRPSPASTKPSKLPSSGRKILGRSSSIYDGTGA
ncbi:MAG: hypothetical protein WCO92_04855 [Verrucomicrobiota bacterium]